MCEKRWVADRLFVNENNWARAGGWKYTVPCVRSDDGSIIALCGKPPAFCRLEDGAWASQEDVVIMAAAPELLSAAIGLCASIDSNDGVDAAKLKMLSLIERCGQSSSTKEF